MTITEAYADRRDVREQSFERAAFPGSQWPSAPARTSIHSGVGRVGALVAETGWRWPARC
jgi:hypothetical protein